MSQRRFSENLKYLETNENKNIMCQNLCNAARTVLKGRFIAVHMYIKKETYLKSTTLLY